MKKIVLFVFLILQVPSEASDRTLDLYSKTIDETSITYDKNDGSGYVSVQILPPKASVNTTKEYALSLMDSYQGFNLKAQLDLRGFSFNFVDNAPCSALLSYFDGSNYLLYKSCGNNDVKTQKEIFKEAKEKLHLDKKLKQSSRANFY